MSMQGVATIREWISMSALAPWRNRRAGNRAIVSEYVRAIVFWAYKRQHRLLRFFPVDPRGCTQPTIQDERQCGTSTVKAEENDR